MRQLLRGGLFIASHAMLFRFYSRGHAPVIFQRVFKDMQRPARSIRLAVQAIWILRSAVPPAPEKAEANTVHSA